MEILADEDGKITKFRVNSYQANGEVAHLRLRVGRGVMPTLARSLGENSSEMTDLPDDDESLDGSAFERRLLQITDGMFHGRTARNTKLALLRSIGVGSPRPCWHAPARSARSRRGFRMRPMDHRFVYLQEACATSFLQNTLAKF